MKLVKLLSIALIAQLTTACVIHVGGGEKRKADIELTESLSLSSAGIEELVIDNGAGKIEISGDDSISEIQVEAYIITSKDVTYRLELEKTGPRAYLVAKHDSYNGFWIGDSPKIDITVKVPSNMSLDIDDGSGEITINNVAGNALIDDGSGDITVSNLSGSLKIEDGSGDMELTNIGGPIDIDDGSGSIYVTKVSGDLSIEDGSGDMYASIIAGKVTVDDGSGDIEIESAGGFELIESGSGGLKIKDIKGVVNIDD
jgi:hypothetical protein